MQMSYLVNDWKYLRNFPPKTGLREKQVLQDPGYVEGVKTTCCMLYDMLQGCTKHPMSKESKEIKIAIIQ